MTVAIVDYGLGNLGSIRRALEECGAEAFFAVVPEELREADHIVLPGVGAFHDGMLLLEQGGWISALRQAALVEKVPLLGICLGMQLLASTGEEGGEKNGLGLIAGRVSLLPVKTGNERLPHVGWNNITKRGAGGLLENIPDGADFYFVHSYHFKPEEEAVVVATGDYAGGFVAAVEKDNVFGTQFHPEKSGPYGFQILKNFLHYYGNEE